MVRADETGAAGGLGHDLSAALQRLSSRFFADAPAVETAESIPDEHLRLLADAGLYGLFAPRAEGGLGLGYQDMCSVVEELSSGCLASTFVWAQHFRLLGSMLDREAPAALRDKYLRGAISGEIKGGVALTGLLPGPPKLIARPVPGGWRLEGEAPWVSGWGIVDIIVVLARGPGDTVVTLLLDAKPQPGLSITPLRLVALNASRTVRARFGGVLVRADMAIAEQDYETARTQSERLRLNGSFSVGLVRRCCSLMGPSPFDQELADCRAALDGADEAALPAARAWASELAARASASLVVSRGSRSALVGDVAERLRREATFLLVFGSRPAIKDSLLARLSSRAAPSVPQR
jgi:alkylation response protein AidB-like acyl-CoA dehydrogenase